MEIIVRRK